MSARKPLPSAKAHLRGLLPIGSAFYASTDHVSTSGMTRWVRAYCVSDGHILNITSSVARACGLPLVERDGRSYIKIGGCGFDVATKLADDLCHHIYGTSHYNTSQGFVLRPETL